MKKEVMYRKGKVICRKEELMYRKGKVEGDV